MLSATVTWGKANEPTFDEIRSQLWNSDVTPASFGGEDKYHAALLDQYKMYVEMADRISSRRGLTNTFFLTLNTLVFSVVGVFWKDRPQHLSTLALALVLVVAVAQCGAWWMIVRSYRQLNAGKYKVVGLLEERLPASPYWSAEWKALGEGRDPRLYLPLTHVEQWVPITFAAVYVTGFALAVSA
jgi:hypothetical protein